MTADPYADLGNAPVDMQRRLLAAMVARAEDPAQIAMRRGYLSALEVPEGVSWGSASGVFLRPSKATAVSPRSWGEVKRRWDHRVPSERGSH